MASGRYLSDDGRRALFSILPPFGYAVLLMLVPLIAVLVISFQVRNAGYGFGNYLSVFTDPINVRGAYRGGDWVSPLVYTGALFSALAAIVVLIVDLSRSSSTFDRLANWVIPALGVVWFLYVVASGRSESGILWTFFATAVLTGLAWGALRLITEFGRASSYAGRILAVAILGIGAIWYIFAHIIGGGIWLPGLLPRSLFISIAVTTATVVTAYPIAYFISFRVSPANKSLWLFLITIPFWTSYLIRIFLWKVILGYSGVVNTALLGIGFIDEPLTFILYNANAVIITLAHAYAPFAILPIFVALEKIDRSLKEASRDLGENRFATFLRVTLPLSVSGIVAAVLIVFIPTIGDYVTPELVGGSGGLLIANRIQSLFLQVNDPGLGAALSLTTMLAVGLVSLIFVAALGRWLRRA